MKKTSGREVATFFLGEPSTFTRRKSGVAASGCVSRVSAEDCTKRPICAEG